MRTTAAITAITAGLCLAACGADTTTQTVAPLPAPRTATVHGSTQAAPARTQTAPTASPQPAEDKPQKTSITRADAQDLYGDYMDAVLAEEVDAACDMLSDDYRDEFVAKANQQTSADIGGPDCQAVTRKIGALMAAFGVASGDVVYGAFHADGAQATLQVHVGDNTPETVSFSRDDDTLKLSGDE